MTYCKYIYFLWIFAAYAWEKPVLMLDPPSDFNEKAHVACVLPFVENDRVLLLQRVPSHAQGNLWTAPGGKILKGKTPSAAAVRELFEETGLSQIFIHLSTWENSMSVIPMAILSFIYLKLLSRTTFFQWKLTRKNINRIVFANSNNWDLFR